MAEGTETTATAQATTTASTASTDAAQTAPESFINSDGTFKEGWQNQLVPEDLRPLGVYKTFSDIKGAMKQLGNLEKLRGRQGKGLMPLTADSTPTERDLFFKAIGRPDKPGDYKIEIPKELSQYYDPVFLSEAPEALYQAGLTQEQVSAVMAIDAKRLTAGIAKLEVSQKAEREAGEAALKTEWGAKFPANMAIANRAIEEAGLNAQDKSELLAKMGNSPVLAKFLSSIGRKFMEDRLPGEVQGGAGALTPAEAKLRASEIGRELIATPNMRYDNPSKYARLNKELDETTKMALAGQQK